MEATHTELPKRPLPPRTARERVTGWVQWVGPGRLTGAAVVVLAVLAAGYWLVKPPPATTESTLPYAAPHTTTSVAGASSTSTAPSAAAATVTATPTRWIWPGRHATR